MKAIGLDDPHRLRRGGRDIPEIQVDHMFVGRRGKKELICALHTIDTEFLARVVIRADKGPIDFIISGILEFLGEIDSRRIVIPQRQRTGELIWKSISVVISGVARGVLVDSSAQRMASQSFLCWQGRIHSFPEVQGQDLHWRDM